MKLLTNAYRWFAADLKIGSRLVIAFAVLIALGLTGSIVGSWRLLELKRLAERMATVDAELMVNAADWERAIQTNSLRTDIIFFTKDAEVIKKTKDAQQAGVEETNRRNERIKELIAGDPKAEGLFNGVLKQRKDYIAYRNVLKSRLEAGDDVTDEVKSLLQPAAVQYDLAVQAFGGYAHERLATNRIEVQKNAAAGQKVLLGSALIAVLASIALGWVIRRSLVKPVQDAVGAASAIATGDLTRTMDKPGNDELGQLSRAVSAMQDALRGSDSNVQASSENIAAGTSQIAAGNADLSTRTE
ncbi:MAG TPA: HAMP domain-containing protein [Ramlibacter sp.]